MDAPNPQATHSVTEFNSDQEYQDYYSGAWSLLREANKIKDRQDSGDTE